MENIERNVFSLSEARRLKPWETLTSLDLQNPKHSWQMTPMQMVVGRYFSEGWKVPQIASKLRLSPSTVKKHLHGNMSIEEAKTPSQLGVAGVIEIRMGERPTASDLRTKYRSLFYATGEAELMIFKPRLDSAA